jgi:hypothetical protein
MQDVKSVLRFKQGKPYHTPIAGGLRDAAKNCLDRKIKSPVLTPSATARRKT